MSTDHDPTIASPSKQLAEQEQQSANRAAALLAPLEAKARQMREHREATLRAAVLREAADVVGNDDTCDCGGCDSCVPNKLAARLREMADEAQQQPETETPTAQSSPVCEGFVWIGQSFAICDRCGQPAWEHEGEEVPVDGAGLFDSRRTVRPWKPGQADAIRAKWGHLTVDARQDGAPS